MLNRTLSPGLIQPEKINIPEPDKILLKNGIPVYLINQGTQEVCKIEFLFAAGSLFESNPLVAAATNELIDEGTTLKSSAQIAEIFDYYGAYLQTECTADWASVSLFTLNKFSGPTVDLLLEVLSEASFPEKELETFIVQGKQRLSVNMEKVDYLARKHFAKVLFGDHAYGYFKKAKDYDQLNRALLVDFHQSFYTQNVKGIFISGRLSDEEQQKLLTKLEGSELHPKVTDFSKQASPRSYSKQNLHIEKPEAVQNAIRIGCPLVNRTHPDYPKLTILNTILGGYFGSRLMSNIREDKGYTYGIGSGIASMQQSGYFYIATEVGAQVCNDAVKEIYKEIERLQNEPVPEEELDLVRNYLAGSFQRSIDGPFAVADRFKSIVTYGLSSEYFNRYLHHIKTISAQELQELARLYLSLSDLSRVTAGMSS